MATERLPRTPLRAGPPRHLRPVPDEAAAELGPGYPWVWMYHSVSAGRQDDPYQLTVAPERFTRQMEWLARTGRRGVAMAELVRAQREGRAEGLVGITFDDGYADFPRSVLPVLDRLGFTASAYVVAGQLGGWNSWDAEGPRRRLLTAPQVRELARAGWEIGSHSLTHLRMDGSDREALRHEARRSREVLEDVLGAPVTGFCYPYGAHGAEAVEAVRDAGYDYAVAICHSPFTGRWALPRSYVGQRDGALRLRAKHLRHQRRNHRCARGHGWQGQEEQ